MSSVRRIAITTFLLLACIGCDQATKTIALRELPSRSPVALVGEILHLHYAENSGAMLGIGSELSHSVRFLLFVVFAGTAMAMLLAFIIFFKGLNTTEIVSLSLILGGGMGNLLDRLFRSGNVVDFMIIAIGPLRTSIFNFADLMILLGLALLLATRLPWRQERRQQEGTVETGPDS